MLADGNDPTPNQLESKVKNTKTHPTPTDNHKGAQFKHYRCSSAYHINVPENVDLKSMGESRKKTQHATRGSHGPKASKQPSTFHKRRAPPKIENETRPQ